LIDGNGHSRDEQDEEKSGSGGGTVTDVYKTYLTST
jgi:hypothetical protein